MLQTHYDILGISVNATDEQIKSAFRRLAKLYHPDKNPNGKDQFEKILLAYEILIDSAKRRAYDLRLKGYSAASPATKKTSTPSGQKNWNFSDEELKRRQYFQENYKREYQQYVKTKEQNKSKATYNEYKYILFATPLAVLLFLLVIKGLEGGADDSDIKSPQQEINTSEIKMGSDPYTSYFKNPVYDTISNRTLLVKNISPFDLVINALGKEGLFIRSFVLKQGFYVELEKMPETVAYLKISAGKKWNSAKEYKNLDVIGGFEDKQSFYLFDMSNSNGWTMTIDESFLNACEEINETDFFKRN